MRLSDEEALAFDSTVLDAADYYVATEVGADLEQARDDEMGIGRVIGLLFRRVVVGR